MGTHLQGRAIVEGQAKGLALVSRTPISFLGGVDGERGIITETDHPLYGESVAGRILVFPHGKGSTVGSYVIYRLARAGLAPAAIINVSTEPIVAVGALIADIPLVDQVDISQIETGMPVSLEGADITLG
ncbi:MAG: DUF126 domain-containing protein [Chloroflexi bacterium]|nr:DUF126 domain-containing protein [Chloroflexota bacterium]